MARLDVRLDDERRARLEELVKEQGVPISELVRRFIDNAYEDVMLQRRREALRRLVKLNIEVPLDPAALSRELEAAHEPFMVS